MSTDPNILAWKGTPGPWKVEINHRNEIVIDGIYGGVIWGVASAGNIKSHEGKMMLANAHMISAAPEATEFIADFLEVMDKIAGVTPELSALIERGEQILKKAYNF